MLFDDLKCNSCHNTIKKDENITIWLNSNALKGYTFLKGWATGQKVLCEKCTEKFFNHSS